MNEPFEIKEEDRSIIKFPKNFSRVLHLLLSFIPLILELKRNNLLA